MHEPPDGEQQHRPPGIELPDVGQHSWQPAQDSTYVGSAGWQPGQDPSYGGPQQGWVPPPETGHGPAPGWQPAQSGYGPPAGQDPAYGPQDTGYADPQQDPAHGRHSVDEEFNPSWAYGGNTPPGTASRRSAPVLVPLPRQRLVAVAWAALAIGVAAVVVRFVLDTTITMAVAGVGVLVAVAALFGSKKLLAGVGGVLSAVALGLTFLGGSIAVADLDDAVGDDTEALADVSIRNCVLLERDGIVAEATIDIANGTEQAQSYVVTVSVDDASGDRVAQIIAVASNVDAGKNAVLSGGEATDKATSRAEPGPANCSVARVERLALG